MRIRPVTVWALRGSKRTHLSNRRLMSYPVKEVAECGVTVGIMRVGTRTMAYQDFQLTCPGCRKVAPWLRREPR